jgi:Yip1 domain
MGTVPAPTPEPIAVPAPEPQGSISQFGRLVGVIFSPSVTFADIARKPSWLLPVIILALLGVGVAVGINQKMDWREYMSQQIEKSSRGATLTPEQKEQQISMGAKIAPISAYVFGIPAPVVVVLVVALIMWGAYNLLGGANLGYKTSLGIVSHAFVPAIIGNFVFLIVLFLKPRGTLDLDNPVATNIAAFLPDDAAKWLVALCKNLDVFALWILVLIAIGFAAANPKKLKGGKAFTIAFTVWAAYVVIRVGFAFIFS